MQTPSVKSLGYLQFLLTKITTMS